MKAGAIICLVGDLNQLKTDTFEIEWRLEQIVNKPTYIREPYIAHISYQLAGHL